MRKEQYEQIREFAQKLPEKRLQIPDGQLLDQCQQHLDALLAHVELDFEEHPHEQPIPEDEPYIDDEAQDEPPIPPQLHRQPGPPPPPPSEPEPEVQHHETHHKAVAHKRPTPRKTRR